ADEFLPELVRSGSAQGLPSEGLFKQLQAMQERGEALDVTRLEDSLSTEEKHLAYEAALASGDLPDRGHLRACLQALKRMRMEREREGLRSAIEAADRAKDMARLTELQRSKLELE